MAQIPQDYIDNLKSSSFYLKLKEGLSNEKLNIILTGSESYYSLSSNSDYLNQDASMIILYFHALASDRLINVNLLSIGVDKIELNRYNILLVMDYLYNFLLYDKDNQLLNFETQQIWKKVQASDFYKPEIREQSYLVGKILELITEEKVHQFVENTIEINEALKFFILAVVVKSIGPTTEFTLTRFFNYYCDIFENITSILNQLEKESIIQYKANSFVIEGTIKAEVLLQNAPMSLVFQKLKPIGEKLSFYNNYIKLLK